jgi:hypothetical protein
MTLWGWQLIGCMVGFAWLARKLFRELVDSVGTAGRGLYAALLVVLIFPGMLLGLGLWAENRLLSDFTDLGALPWSVVFGGGLVLPLALVVAAKSAPDWFDSSLAISQWRRVCGWFGLVVGSGIHILSSSSYRASGDGNRISSITRLWYDFAVYPILVGALLYVGVLIFKHSSRRYQLALVVLLVIQLTLTLVDATRDLDPAKLHAACDLVCGSESLLERLVAFSRQLIGQ